MSKPKYTQGPWKWTVRPDLEAQIYTEDNFRVAETIGAANAQLIASAPDLLSTLENLIERDLIKDIEGDHMEEIERAIAKAKGELL